MINMINAAATFGEGEVDFSRFQGPHAKGVIYGISSNLLEGARFSEKELLQFEKLASGELNGDELRAIWKTELKDLREKRPEL